MPSTVRSRPHRRTPRRRLVVFGVAALVLVAACQPVKNSGPPTGGVPSVYCVPASDGPPDSALEYQRAFDNLRKFNTGGWIANDGGYPFKLGDGRVLWLFGDTLLGLSPGGPVKTLLGIVNNGFVVQDGGCFTPITEPVGDPDDLPGDEWIWPTGLVVADGQVHVFGSHMRRTSGPPPFNFALVDMDVTTFSLADLKSPIDQRHVDLPSVPTYGTAVLLEGGFVYAYGGEVVAAVGGAPAVARQYVARVPVGQVLDEDAWEFWGDEPEGDGWVENDLDAVPMMFDDGDGVATTDEGPVSAFPVTRNPKGGYLGSAFPADVTDTTVIETWHGLTPTGPWTRTGAPAVTTTEYHGVLGTDRLVYGGRVVFDAPGEPLALWSTHHFDFNQVLQNPAFYKVWFAPADPDSIPIP